MPDWNGERLSLERAAGAANLQIHWTRYVWALKYVEGKRHLDIGCGTGYGTWLLSQVTALSVGIDPCAAAIAEAQARYQGANLIYQVVGLEECDRDGDPAFEVVTAFESLEHLADIEGGLDLLCQHLLLSDGVLLGSVPLCAGANPYHHGRGYDAPQWAEVLTRRFAALRWYYQPIGWPVEAVQPNTDILPLQSVADIADRADGNLLFVLTQKELL